MNLVQRTRGFTLIELLVALTILAMMSLMAWYGLDGVIRSRAQSQSDADRLARMAAALDQLAADARAASDLGTEGVFMLADGLQITRNRATPRALQPAQASQRAATRQRSRFPSRVPAPPLCAWKP